MGLFDGLKGKKYPGSRKAGGRMGRVYAGPPRKQEDDSEETPLAAGVYAGPGMMGGLRPDDPEMTEVYAGPGMMGEIGCDEPEEPAEEAPAEDAPAEEAPRNPKPAGSMMFVYAGPAYFANKNQTPMMTAYAGPAQMTPQLGAINVPVVPQPENNRSGKSTVCRYCGAEILSGFRFCPECGGLVKTDEEQVDV